MVYEMGFQMLDRSFGTLGEAVLAVKREMLSRGDDFKDLVGQMVSAMLTEEEYADHLHYHNELYHLHGDPGLIMRMPDRDVSLSLSSDSCLPGETLVVDGTVASIDQGGAYVTLETRRSVIYWDLEPVPEEEDPDREDVIHANYEKANNKVVMSMGVDVQDGAFETSFELPYDFHPGHYYVKVLASNSERDAVGSAFVAVVEP